MHLPLCLGISLTRLDRMGELEPWVDENFVRSVWFGMGEQVNVKMIRDKFSGYVTTLWRRHNMI